MSARDQNMGPQTRSNLSPGNTLRARRLGIETLHEAVVYMRKDCHLCRAEGFSGHARVRASHRGRSIIATLHHVTSEFLDPGYVGLSESAWSRLGMDKESNIEIDHPRPLNSLSDVRSKVYGHRLEETSLREMVTDIVAGRFSDIHLSSFITACSSRGLDRDETLALTRAMIDVGDKLTWPSGPVADKHCIGGLPGNRTTPIVVAIAASCGLVMPKTSSRAITSPAGTADMMETLAPVELDVRAMRRVVESEGGCIIWGGAVELSPADDILIRVERALGLDTEGQLVASVLSKKVAAGATHLVLDLPVGPTAKVRDQVSAEKLSKLLLNVGNALGVTARVMVTDGSQTVGRRIGPALEARDVLAVLKGDADGSAELRARAVSIAATLLELVGVSLPGAGLQMALASLIDGQAWQKFQAICEAQGGMREPPLANYMRTVSAAHEAQVRTIDNRLIAMVAKLAGAPEAKAAGVELHVKVRDKVSKTDPLYTVHAETQGELDYALAYVNATENIVELGDP